MILLHSYCASAARTMVMYRCVRCIPKDVLHINHLLVIHRQKAAAPDKIAFYKDKLTV